MKSVTFAIFSFGAAFMNTQPSSAADDAYTREFAPYQVIACDHKECGCKCATDEKSICNGNGDCKDPNEVTCPSAPKHC